MPGTITHYWVFKAYVDRAAPKGAPPVEKKPFDRHTFLARLQKAEKELADALSEPKTSKLADNIAGYGYLGATGPDLPFMTTGKHEAIFGNNAKVARLMHHNKTGTLVIKNLADLKVALLAKEEVTENDKLWQQIAYWIGHVTHIAADVVVHPFVNSMAGALRGNEKLWHSDKVWAHTKRIWSHHNKVEHYQDAYVRYELLEVTKTGAWREVNFPLFAAKELKESKSRLFIIRNVEEFYGTTHSKRDQEKPPCRFITAESGALSWKHYCTNVIPEEPKGEELAHVVRAELFKKYLRDAVTLADKMTKEVFAYLEADPKNAKKYYEDLEKDEDPDQKEHLYYEKKTYFPLLRRNWNLDSGHGFEFERTGASYVPSYASGAPLNVPVRMRVEPYLDAFAPTQPHGDSAKPGSVKEKIKLFDSKPEKTKAEADPKKPVDGGK